MHNPGAFVFARNASVHLHPHLLTKKEGITVYFIAAIMIDPQKGAGEYEGYNEESYDDDAEYSENMNDALPDEDIQDGDVEEEAGNEELE